MEPYPDPTFLYSNPQVDWIYKSIQIVLRTVLESVDALVSHIGGAKGREREDYFLGSYRLLTQVFRIRIYYADPDPGLYVSPH